MKLSLAENICQLRKAHSMTQEQLAEALGVTFASVSKWERGVATPELKLIAQMADLFGVSLDALVGFSLTEGGVAASAERIHQLQRQKRYDEAVMEAEKALLRYPNDFRIVYRAGELYALAGIERKREKEMRRCIELLEHAILLLSQNDDPDISEISIRNEIAQSYLALGEFDRGIDMLKKNNVAGLNDALIAMNCAGREEIAPKESEPYMTGAFCSIMTSAVRTMMAYATYYARQKKYRESREAMLWLVEMLQGAKTNPDAVAYVDKVIAPCYSECANMSLRLGETEKVVPYLRRAYRVAVAFDAAPTYRLDNIKFCIGDIEKATAYDDMGESAIASVEKQLRQPDRDGSLLQIWNELKEGASK